MNNCIQQNACFLLDSKCRLVSAFYFALGTFAPSAGHFREELFEKLSVPETDLSMDLSIIPVSEKYAFKFICLYMACKSASLSMCLTDGRLCSPNDFLVTV